VKTPCSLVRLEMSSASGPMVPETAFNTLVFPVARFLSSYFVLMRLSDEGLGSLKDPQPCTAVHRNQGSASKARASERGPHEVRAACESQENWQSFAPTPY